MSRKLILGISSFAFSLLLVTPTVVMADIAPVAEETEAEPCSGYVWMYKEVDGKKYMRLWDGTYSRWVTDWILVE